MHAAWIYLLVATATASPPPIISTALGNIHGSHCDHNVKAVFYKGIPYAEPPVDELRFAAPRAYSSRYPDGVLNATTAAPSCIQFGETFAESGAVSENCLFLDVWSPLNATRLSNLPVKVWVYGGYEYDGGISDPLYDGCNAAAQNAIVVSVNYRLGPLGFLALAQAGIEGNQGIQDILMALQWIQDHIERFGGDPSQVVLFGQSAGAINTYIISTLPQAPQLIRSAIMESGGGREIATYDTMQTLGTAYTRSLNCSIVDDTCLRNRSVLELRTAWSNLPLLQEGVGADGVTSVVSRQKEREETNTRYVKRTTKNHRRYSFVPYYDGRIIPAKPSEVGTQVPAVFGYNTNDGALFVFAAYEADPDAFTDQPKAYDSFLQKNFGPAASLVKEHYGLSRFGNTTDCLYAAMTTVITDSSYKCPAYRGLKRALDKNIPVWAYEFGHVPFCSWSPSLPQAVVQLLGPTHTAEIPFVFGNLDHEPRPNGTCNGTVSERVISEAMMQAWRGMAAFGSPAVRNSWPQYDQKHGQGWLINQDIAIKRIEFDNCDLWEQVYEMLSWLSFERKTHI